MVMALVEGYLKGHTRLVKSLRKRTISRGIFKYNINVSGEDSYENPTKELTEWFTDKYVVSDVEYMATSTIICNYKK